MKWQAGDVAFHLLNVRWNVSAIERDIAAGRLDVRHGRVDAVAWAQQYLGFNPATGAFSAAGSRLNYETERAAALSDAALEVEGIGVVFGGGVLVIDGSHRIVARLTRGNRDPFPVAIVPEDAEAYYRQGGPDAPQPVTRKPLPKVSKT